MRPWVLSRSGTGCQTRCRPQSSGGTQIRLPVGGGLSPSRVARGGRSCRATWRKASKRKSLTPSPRVAAWTRVFARMRWVVPEVWTRVPGGAAVPLRGCVGRRVWAVRRLVVRGVMGGGGVGWGGWLSLSLVGSGDGVRWRVPTGASTSIGWCWLPRVASVAWSRRGVGRGGVGVALLVVGGAGVGVVRAGGLGVPVGRVGVACVRRAEVILMGLHALDTDSEAVPRTPWPGYGIQPVSGSLTPCTACSVP